MSDQDSLFGDLLNDGQVGIGAPPAPPVLSQWRVDQLRQALDKRGLTTMPERQSAVEAVLGRGVANLRQLTVAEATTVLEALIAANREPHASNWDAREEATWIDRL